MVRCVWALQGEELLDFIAQAQHDDARGWIHEAIAVLRHEELNAAGGNIVGDLVCKVKGDS